MSQLGSLIEKIETFEITRTDRSVSHLTISQKSTEDFAHITGTVQLFVPLSAAQLEYTARENGPKIVRFAESRLGTKVGNGECWTLADEALKAAGVSHTIGTNFGQEITIEGVAPGDVLQMRECVFEFPNGGKVYAGMPDHTAILTSKRAADGSVSVLEQNPSPVKVGNYNFKYLTKGEYKFYRPLPAKA